MEMKPVELDTLLLEVVRQMKALAGGSRGIQITEIDQAQVLGDADRLKQVFLNIIGNAVQHTPVGTQIKMALRLSGRQAQVSISDNGPGIPPEDLPHIFERFYRGEKSRKRRSSTSFGLGLSIAYWIVRNHGGTIEVQSLENKGTTFTVWLPLIES
jgi:signal transduction histidine kinase